jgi:cytochrome bd-type quinol oxidase subunit 2
MLQSLYYHLVDAIVYLIAAAIPTYFILKSRKSIDNRNNHLLRLTIVLVGFILIQVFYHIAGIAGFRLLAKGILEPLSMAVLLVFGIIYVISIWKTKTQRQQQEARV